MDRVQYCVLRVLFMLPVFHNNTFGRRRCTAEFRVVGYFENLVSKTGMTHNISPSFSSSHSTSLGMLRQLRSGRHHANLDACEGPTRRQIGQTSPQGSSASVEGRLPFALHMR